MGKLIIPSEDAQQLYHEQDEINGVRFVDKIYYGEWRWGIQYELIIQDVLTEKLYSTVVQEQSGDHWYLSLEDEDHITFYEVERIEKITYAYKRVKNDS